MNSINSRIDQIEAVQCRLFILNHKK